MTKQSTDLYIGLLSGTSVDAVDAVLVDCRTAKPELIASHSEPFTAIMREEITTLFEPAANEIERLGKLDRDLAQLFSTAVNNLLKQSGVNRKRIVAIGCHGQTIRHRPNQMPPFTLQVGDPNTLAEESGINVVADFRRRDIAAGGQGAPLVPAFHECCFRHKNTTRCILNIGGIANISLLRPQQPTMGFDTGPGNGLMDFWINHNRGLSHDNKGLWAQGGNVNETLLHEWLNHPYFSKPAPKSTGKEEFSSQWLLNSLKSHSLSNQRTNQDIQRTLLELSARSIANAIKEQSDCLELYVCGGGSYNDYLLTRIHEHVGLAVQTTDALGMPVDWVEAIAFAWLAYRRCQNLPGNTPSVTGAKAARVLGGLYLA